MLELRAGPETWKQSTEITKIEPCCYKILTYTSSIRKIGGSNPPLGTTQTKYE